jgi:hypothetical protein
MRPFGAIVIACAITVNALAQHSSIQEAPSTVNAQYVEASPATELKPGEKIGKLFTLNSSTEFILAATDGADVLLSTSVLRNDVLCRGQGGAALRPTRWAERDHPAGHQTGLSPFL